MTIYKRTTAGDDAALNSKSSLPRKLRTLLIAVDGRTATSTYVDSLSSFGDVGGLLNLLLEAELIELSITKKPFDGLRENVSTTTANIPTRPPALSATFVPSSNRKIISPASDQYQLRKVISFMSDFVLVNLPEQSLEIVLVFEELASVEQLAQSLKGYEAMIAHTGTPAQVHLAELQKLLASI